MAVDVDTLQIEIEAESTDAAAKVNALSVALERLSKAVGGSGNLQNVAKQLGQVGQATSRSSAGLDQVAKRAKSISSIVTSVSKIEKELASTEAQAERAGEKLLDLQNRLEGLQEQRGIGNPLTNAGIDAQIKETEVQIKELSASVDNADAKIHALRRTIQNIGDAVQPVQQVSDSIKSVASGCENVMPAVQKAGDGLKAVASAPIQKASDSLKTSLRIANGYPRLQKKRKPVSTEHRPRRKRWGTLPLRRQIRVPAGWLNFCPW